MIFRCSQWISYRLFLADDSRSLKTQNSSFLIYINIGLWIHGDSKSIKAISWLCISDVSALHNRDYFRFPMKTLFWIQFTIKTHLFSHEQWPICSTLHSRMWVLMLYLNFDLEINRNNNKKVQNFANICTDVQTYIYIWREEHYQIIGKHTNLL